MINNQIDYHNHKLSEHDTELDYDYETQNEIDKLYKHLSRTKYDKDKPENIQRALELMSDSYAEVIVENRKNGMYEQCAHLFFEFIDQTLQELAYEEAEIEILSEKT